MMTNAAVKPADSPQFRGVISLEREIRDAHSTLQACFQDIEEVLSRPQFNAGALTSIRLKLAGLRLTRGPLVTRVGLALAGKVTAEEAEILVNLRSSHQAMLKIATAHTSKWTIEAIARNWAQYGRETRELMKRWVAKSEKEQQLVCPLLRRCA